MRGNKSSKSQIVKGWPIPQQFQAMAIMGGGGGGWSRLPNLWEVVALFFLYLNLIPITRWWSWDLFFWLFFFFNVNESSACDGYFVLPNCLNNHTFSPSSYVLAWEMRCSCAKALLTFSGDFSILFLKVWLIGLSDLLSTGHLWVGWLTRCSYKVC